MLIPSSPSETSANSASPPASAISESLRRQFSERDWFPVLHHDPYLALSELALRDRAQTTRAAWGLQRMEGIALVILQPETWPQPLMDDLTSAARRCVSGATIWTVTDERIEPALSRPNDPAARATSNPAPFARSSNVPASRATDADRLPAEEMDHGKIPAENQELDRMARLSREEIDMLLQENADAATQATASHDDGGPA